MKTLYKKNKEDVKALCDLLEGLEEPIISIEPCRGYVIDNGKSINVCNVVINGQKTLFSLKLVNFLKENKLIEITE